MMAFEHAVKIYEGIRRYAWPLHPLVRSTGRIYVQAYAKLKRFELPQDQPHNYRFLMELYEPGTVAVVKRLLKRGMVAVDIGAHIGYFTRIFALLVGDGGKVYAFEPHPKTFAVLERNTRMFSNVNLLNMAVLDKEGTIELYESINSATNSIWPMNTRGGPIRSSLVKAVTLDEALYGVHANLIKIDIEGAELEALNGMHSLLQRSADLSLIIECNPSCLVGRGKDSRLLFENIRDLGFRVQAINESTCKVEPVNTHTDLARLLARGVKYVNLLCIQSS